MRAFETLQFTLPVGLHLDGHHINTFTLNHVTGRLRREMLDAGTQAKANTAAMRHVIASLGTQEKPEAIPRPDLGLIRRLCGPDVDYINFVLCAREFDNSIAKWEEICPGHGPDRPCGAKLPIELDLRQVELIEATGDVHFNKDGNPYQQTSFVDPITNQEVQIAIRLSNLGDLERATERALQALKDNKGAKVGSMAFAELTNLIFRFGTKNGLTAEDLDNMPYKTLTALERATGQVRPRQLDSDVVHTCATCYRDCTFSVSWDMWQDPFGGQGPSPS